MHTMYSVFMFLGNNTDAQTVETFEKRMKQSVTETIKMCLNVNKTAKTDVRFDVFNCK